MASYTLRQIRQAKILAKRVYQFPDGTRVFLRFTKTQRYQHQAMIFSFATLSITGLVQRYSQLKIAEYIINHFLGGINTVQVTHHIAATIFIILALYHFGKLLKMLVIDQELGHMWPSIKDMTDLRDMILFNIGKKENRPSFDRYTIEQKFEYWGLIWVTVVMIISGLIQWFPVLFTKVFTGSIVPISRSIHSWEAVLAVLLVLIWHMYHTLVKEKNNSIFSGYLNESQMQENHPLELIRIMDAVKLTQEISNTFKS